jgi:beta-galactosidase
MKHKSLVRIAALTVVLFASAARAQLVSNGPRATLNLNGEWQTAPTAGLDFQYPPPAQGWLSEKVPHERATLINTPGGPYMMPVRQHFNEAGTAWKNPDKMAAWFKRDFAFPANALAGRRAVLHFHGMAFRSDTWFNGQKLGTSVLGQVPIEYDVTSLLKPGATNQIVVGLAGREGIIDLANKTYIAPGSGVQAGIWGDVELRLMPAMNIDDVFIKTSVREKRIDLEVTLANGSTAAHTVRPEVLQSRAPDG